MTEVVACRPNNTGISLQDPVTATTTGRSYPIGATLAPGGANFSVFSRSATQIDLLLFDRVDDARPSRVIPIDPSVNRTYTIGTCSCRMYRRVRSMDSVPTDRSSRLGVSGSMHPNYCSTHTVAP